jgi:hypothetical protein
LSVLGHSDAFGVVMANRFQRLARFELHIRGRMCVGDERRNGHVIDNDARAVALKPFGIGSRVPEYDPKKALQTIFGRHSVCSPNSFFRNEPTRYNDDILYCVLDVCIIELPRRT